MPAGEYQHMKKEKSFKIGGIPANTIIIPLTVVIAILHIVIVALVFDSNRSNRELSEMMQNCSIYQQNATSLLASSSTMSETASAFVQLPVTQDGAFNSGPLIRYTQELGKDLRGPQVAEWFRSQQVGPEIQAYIDEAALKASQMFEVQLHAIALMRSVYPQPPIEELSAIPDTPLTEEELAMTAEERTEYARSLMFSREYSSLKSSVADSIENCHRTLQMDYAQASAKCEQHIDFLRIWLWIVIITIIILLTGTFVLFYRWLIMPLRSYAGQIAYDQNMEQKSDIREMRLVVNAYNALLRRRNRLESILRSAAETDALTDLPNRYSLEQYMLENSEDSSAMAVLMFDVNYLKQTNDTKGHSAGDRLLRTAGTCIRECFGQENGGRCYRIGGDEFAAVLRCCGEEAVKNRIERFSLALAREKISVSVGYAFEEKTDEHSFDRLLSKADKRMYEQKKHDHERDHAAG